MRAWDSLQRFGDTFTCYSAAMAAWLAHEDEAWPATLNPGLWLVLSHEGEGLFGFAHFPAGLRARLGLCRAGAETAHDALGGVLAELDRSARVIVAGDGFNLPWHVAHGRRHVPHWFVLHGTPDAPTVLDPFAARNELGVQQPARRAVDPSDLAPLLPALPTGDRVLDLREMHAFGDLTQRDARPWQWFVRDDVDDVRAHDGVSGPDAVLTLARHFRQHGQELDAYAQADDIWSIARHRSFLLACAQAQGDASASAWAEQHLAALARKWGHIAPLLMQAILSLRAGRAATTSVPDTLERLAEMEAGASRAAPESLVERIANSG